MDFSVFDLVERNGKPTAQIYEERLQLCEEYDRGGFFSYHVAEHHSTPHGLASSPSVFLSAVAQRTKHLRFGSLVYLMPFYHPLRLVEELCILDQMSLGRLEIGLGRGISPIERKFYGIAPDTAEEMTTEGYDVVVAGLTSETLTFSGKYYQFDQVPMELRPLQQPRPPIWYGLHLPESAQWAAQRRFNMATAAPTAHARDVADLYRAASRTGRAALVRKIVVAQTDTEALDIARRAYPLFFKNFNHLFARVGVQPKNGQRPLDFDAVSAEGTGIAGSPETVAKGLRAQLEGSKFDVLIGEFIFGDMPFEAARESIRLFSREVMPALNSLGDAPVPV